MSISSFKKLLAISLFTTASLVGCKGGGLFNGKLFKERAAEKPAPSEEGIEKSFFVDPNGKPKTFLCAWSPEMSQGAGGEFITLVTNMAMHCNIEFEITESYLVGKVINPSFPNDRTRWKEALKIPIRSHYYYERQKDPHGRKTNEWIENSSRSHWSARPMMKLNLSGMQTWNFGDGDFDWGMSVSSVRDIEWDRQSNFLGFTMNVTASNTWVGGRRGEMQGSFRVNFLKFDHDPTFAKTPYNEENAHYINILHVMGRRVEGTEKDLYAAHWDLRNPHNIYLTGIPADQQKTVIEAVEKWNTTLAEIGVIGKGQKAFIPVVKELKHPFDLRYPALVWISDKRISATSPLGIGMAHADVRNGKILWGGVTLYGGMLESYINRYAPVEAAAATNAASAMESMTQFNAFAPNFAKTPFVIDGLDKLEPVHQEALIKNLARGAHNYEKDIALLAKSGGDPEKVKVFRQQLEQMAAASPQLNEVAGAFIREAQKESREVHSLFQSTTLARQVGIKQTNESLSLQQLAERNGDNRLALALKEKDSATRQARLRNLLRLNNPFFVETDLTAQNMASSWLAAEAQQSRSYPELLESVVADLTLHELGHFIGLGHQFKENIVPDEGTVPSNIRNALLEKADEEHGFTNYTSVMGYRNGRTEMALPASELNPGPHDKLVLRYLYKSQYTVFDRSADTFLYAKVPPSGKIPSQSFVKTKSGEVKNLPTSYFPACNDYEASLDADPFCNRWDRGSKAVDIVASYFQQLNDTLLSRLYSLVSGGGSHWVHEYYLWYASLGTFSRVRLFYDEMRRRMRWDPDLKPLWSRLSKDKEALFEFAQACRRDDVQQIKSQVLVELFKHDDIKDLCRANVLALNEFRYFLNLPEGDNSRIDHTQRYISGGYLEGDVPRNYGGFLGSWYQLSNFPLKFSAMYTLTTANPYQFWDYWMVPNMFFDDAENRVLYRTLYPRDYTQMVAQSVQSNMRFAATGLDETTTMGRTILATSALLPNQRHSSNDSAHLTEEYNQMLEQQTEFQLNMVAVIIKAVPPDANSGIKADHFKKFTGSVYDFMTGRSSTASEVYVLPQGRLLVRSSGKFIYPITKLKFFDDNTSAYVIAYSVSYDYEEGDKLIEDSVKSKLLEKHDKIISKCTEGFNQMGLMSFFDLGSKGFEGFYIPPGIGDESGKEKSGQFLKSIDEAFAVYEKTANSSIPENFPVRTMREVCEEAVKGVGEIAASAALINGYWLNITSSYIVK